MSYKPSDFYVKIIDVLAILLPGAMLSFMAIDASKIYVFGPILPEIQGESQGWIAFIFSSYLMGNFTYVLGRSLNYIYDRTYRKHKRKRGDKLKEFAETIKKSQLGDADEIINTFRWATASLRIRSDAAISEVDRVEAVSKFFRSITVVLFITCIYVTYKDIWIAIIPCLVLMLLSFWRYMEQRWRRTVLTYEFFIVTTKIPNIEKNILPKQISDG